MFWCLVGCRLISVGIMAADQQLEIPQIVVGSPQASPVSSPECSPRAGQHCTLSQKVPKAKTTGNHIRDMQLEFERNQLVQCIDILWEKPKVRAECLAFLQMSHSQQQQDDLGPDYFREVSTLAKLCEDKEWIVAYVCSKTKTSANDLGLAYVENPQCLLHIMEFLLGALRTLKIPHECSKKAVCAKTLDKRIVDAGDRHLLLVNDLVKGGKLNLAIFVYEFVWVEEKASHVTHRPTRCTVLVPAEYTITKQFELIDNFSDMKAYVQQGLNKYCLKDLFLKAQGPHVLPCISGNSRVFNNLVKLAVEQQKVAEDQAAAGPSSGSSAQSLEAFQTPLKDQQRQKLKEAREKMVAKAGSVEEVKKRRVTVQLAVGEVPQPAAVQDLEADGGENVENGLFKD